jgi:TPR repeat protein
VKPPGKTGLKRGVETLDSVKGRALGGKPRAQYEVALCYYLPRLSAPLDLGQALVWLEKAAINGVEGARALFAHCLFNGHGVAKDEAKGVQEAKKAEDEPLAKYVLGVAYLDGRGGVPEDKALAERFFASAKNLLEVLVADSDVNSKVSLLCHKL